MLGIDRPAVAFYPKIELNADATNWSGPNPAAVVAMLRTVGFSRVEIVSKSFPDDIAFDPSSEARPNHVTVHAWK